MSHDLEGGGLIDSLGSTIGPMIGRLFYNTGTSPDDSTKIENKPDNDVLGADISPKPNIETGISSANVQEQLTKSGIDGTESKLQIIPPFTDRQNCENDSCCPPENSRFKTANEYRKYMMKKEINWTSKVLFFSFLIMLGIVGILSFIFYKMIMIVITYVKQLNFSFFPSDTKKNKEIKEKAENKNDFYTYQKGINKTIQNFNHHNRQLCKFFNKTDAPGIINQKILNSKHDNW